MAGDSPSASIVCLGLQEYLGPTWRPMRTTSEEKPNSLRGKTLHRGTYLMPTRSGLTRALLL